jgi:hypothetical protein
MKRLHTEIVDAEDFTFIVDHDPATGEPVGLRIVQRNTKFGKVWSALDGISRTITNIMQGRDP